MKPFLWKSTSSVRTIKNLHKIHSLEVLTPVTEANIVHQSWRPFRILRKRNNTIGVTAWLQVGMLKIFQAFIFVLVIGIGSVLTWYHTKSPYTYLYWLYIPMQWSTVDIIRIDMTTDTQSIIVTLLEMQKKVLYKMNISYDIYFFYTPTKENNT